MNNFTILGGELKSKISVLLKCIYIFRTNYFRNSLAHYNGNLFNDSFL